MHALDIVAVAVACALCGGWRYIKINRNQKEQIMKQVLAIIMCLALCCGITSCMPFWEPLCACLPPLEEDSLEEESSQESDTDSAIYA